MKLWPEPSSTVVSARRVVSAGTLKPLSLTAAFVRQLADFRADAHRDAAVGEHDRREGEADAILLIFDRDRAERLRDRDRELAAGEEAGGFARQRGQVRLGERGDQAVVLGEVERADMMSRPNSLPTPDGRARRVANDRRRPALVDAGRAGRTMPLALADAELEAAGRVAAEQVDADLLEQRAVDLGDPDLEVTCSGVAVFSRLTADFTCAFLRRRDAWTSRCGFGRRPSGEATVPVRSTRSVHRRGAGCSASGIASAQHLVDRAEVLADPDVGAHRRPSRRRSVAIDRGFAALPCRTCRAGVERATWTSATPSLAIEHVGDRCAAGGPAGLRRPTAGLRWLGRQLRLAWATAGAGAADRAEADGQGREGGAEASPA